MTLWLSNLAAYSVQLAALVGSGAIVVALLRVTAPRASLRFWQLLLAVSVLWPAWQLWAMADVEAVRPSALSVVTTFFPGELPWTGEPTSVFSLRTSLGAIDERLIAMTVTVVACGIAMRLAWLALGLIRLRSIVAASEPAPDLSPTADALRRELGVAADIRFSDIIGSPATIGGWRPIVLLPPRMLDVPAAVQRAVLCHELMHVRRRDWVPTLSEEIWCALLWFHPAARALASRLILARETLIDEATIAHTRDRRAYAQALLEFSTGGGARLAGAAGLIGRRHLERRIARIGMEVSMSRPSVTIRLVAAAGAVAIATVLASSALPISAAPQAQSEQVYKSDKASGVSVPQPVKEVKPEYTAAAMRARIQGTVWLAVVVLANGDVGDVTVTKSLDQEHGLDQAAVDAARQWKFKPGTKDGKPVAVEVTIELTFTLK